MKKIINLILIIAILTIIIWFVLSFYRENTIKKKKESSYNVDILDNIEEIYIVEYEDKKEKEEKVYEKEEIIKEYRGYEVLAKLEIPEIKLKTYILKKCTEDSLNKSVAWLWGVYPNQKRKLFYSRA